MGLISTALSAAGSVLADQWKEYFYCEAIPTTVLATVGKKKDTGRSNRGNDNIISNGSVIAVADGQCMLIVEQGKVVDLCAVPGEYVYDSSTEPSIFSGKLGESILEVFKAIGKRFTFGGEIPKDQRVYYINTKELIGNKYGTPAAVPFRVVDKNANIDIDIGMRCFGEYSYRISNPILFYTNICGNFSSNYTRDKLESQMKTELLTAMQPAFAKVSEAGIRYSAIPAHTTEIAEALNSVLSSKWRDLRGIEIVSFGVSSVTANPEDEQMLKELQRAAAFKDPTMGAAYTVAAQAEAMKTAAGNSAGAMTGFMGMGMAMNAGANMTAQNLYAMGQQAAAPAAAAPVAGGWKCPACGAQASGNFCPECGAKKPVENGWTCSCGKVNTGKFCPECGAKKPESSVRYKCSKCGFEPEDSAHPPKFCPECGDPFDENDLV